MRIHLRKSADNPLFDFATATRDAEPLVADASVIKALFPCLAPRPKLISPANLGLGHPATFTRLPDRFDIRRGY